MKLSIKTALPLALSVFALVSFGTTRAQAQTQSAQKQGQSQSAMTDGEIASILSTANQGEVKAAELAKKKAKSKEVKKFADHMIKEHEKNSKEGKALAKKLKIEPTANETAETLKKKSAQTEKELASLSGAEFDKQYMSNQINMHEQLLTDLDQNLIPSAKNPEMKSYLEKTRTHVEEHLNEAKKIESSMNKM